MKFDLVFFFLFVFSTLLIKSVIREFVRDELQSYWSLFEGYLSSETINCLYSIILYGVHIKCSFFIALKRKTVEFFCFF